MVKLKRGDQGWTDFQGRKNTPFRNAEDLMDIRSITTLYGTNAYDPGSKNGKKSDPAAKPVKSTGEVVAFSDASMNLQKIKDAVYKAPEIRLPIVEKIKERIKNNDYPVDTKADSILETLRKNKII